LLIDLKKKLKLKTNSKGTIDSCNGPLQWLHGHTSTITCVDGNVDLGIVVSGSEMGTCLIHDIYTGTFLVSLNLFDDNETNEEGKEEIDQAIHVVRLVPNSSFVVVATSTSLCTFSSSTGKLLKRVSHFSLSIPHSVCGK